MPARRDIKKILIVGAGPIVIGQACEFDYSGTQACKALREEGYQVVLLNSNPATIMTDPEMSDITYIEPVDADTLEKILRKEKPDAILPTLGGQTALNTTLEVAERGILDELSVIMLGANGDVIKKAEDRDLFKKAMQKIGMDLPRSRAVHSLSEAHEALNEIGFPLIIRPAFTLGGSGGGLAYNIEEFNQIVDLGLQRSRVNEVLIEESVVGWKEFELEVMRDKNDNVVIICSIENIDPMGVHTGDSITVAPAQTLTDREYQLLRDSAVKIIREIGVETGGSNIQFAIDPKDGRIVVIEMNPRVSRSSALASKATGFPIAKIAAKLAVGYTLDELPNDITRETPASFEPSIDYVVTKVPRFTFEKFPAALDQLGVQMKSVGEAMAIGRTFRESLQKVLRSLELDYVGFYDQNNDEKNKEQLIENCREPKSDRIFDVYCALKAGVSVETLHEVCFIDPWFLNQMQQIVREENHLLQGDSLNWDKDQWLKVKRQGISDAIIANTLQVNEKDLRQQRKKLNCLPNFALVDTCAGEFAAKTPYYYSNWEGECEVKFDPSKKKIMVLGGGPNRIGQGIEFDYCCVHASMALRDIGYETFMINSNPETVSTDYDTSDQLFFEPLTVEDVINICERVQPDGIIVQFGGQTPLKLSQALHAEGFPIIGTSPKAIDRCEDREEFKALVDKLNLKQPPSGMASSVEEALLIARKIGFPVLARPSYVLGGRGMKIVYSEEDLKNYISQATAITFDSPVLVDKFLEGAVELDVDAISDGETVVIGAILEHIEEAGIHSGDSTAVLPSFSLSDAVLNQVREQVTSIALEVGVVGLMNVQFAIQGEDVFLIEVNPRASRTIPFISKAIGVPLAKLAAQVMVGKRLKDLGFTEEIVPDHCAVKEPVFPFNRFEKVDILLGPEMLSTGEVMGISKSFGLALAKAKAGAMMHLPKEGQVLFSVQDAHKEEALAIAQELLSYGFKIVATPGTAQLFRKRGIEVTEVKKIGKGRPNVLDVITNQEVQLVINSPTGDAAREDEITIRRNAVYRNIPCITTMNGARAAARAMHALVTENLQVNSLQEYCPIEH